MQSKLTEVRAKADEARAAKLRANAALYEGLAAAYDFALDAEDAPEEYLRLVEAQGLKIQLRAPMKPVVKLAFDGLCDDSTIAQLEAVLAWALEGRAAARNARRAPRGRGRHRRSAERSEEGRLSGRSKLRRAIWPACPAEAEALDERIDRALAGQLGKNVNLVVVRLPRQPVRARGDVAQVLDRFLAQLRVVLEQLVEHGFGQRLFEFDADELLAVPDDPAILILESRDGEPDLALLGDVRGALDSGAMRRDVDHPHLRLAAAPLPHRGGEVQRRAVGAPAFWLAVRPSRGISHAESPFATPCAQRG